MGSRDTTRMGTTAAWQVVPATGPVAQVAHPDSIQWTAGEAVRVLLAASENLPPEVRLLVTGGGHIKVDYPKRWLTDSEIRRLEFLEELHAWTLSQLAEEIKLAGEAKRDMVIGVDVVID